MEKLLFNIGAAYIRVSDERQDEYSPDSQLKKIREYAAREGYQIPEEYVYYDDGISGRSTRGRNDFRRMIEDAQSKEHPFGAIYVWKFSRFARNMEDSIIYKSMLRKHNVSVVSVSEPIPQDSFGPLIEHIIEWMDQHYVENLAEEVKRGISEKIARKEPICPPPFGYVMHDKQYFIVEEQAEIVREVFSRYAAGEKQREIAISLGARGVRTRFGNPPDNRYIDYMLCNPVYVGKLRYSLDASKYLNMRRYDEEDVIIVDGSHTPIITIELWEEVQERRRAQKLAYGYRARTERKAEYMLKGLIRCGSCGSMLCMGVKHGKKGISSLQCHSYSRGSCTVSHSITVPKADAAFVQGLRDAVATGQFAVLPKKPKPKPKPKADSIDYNKLIAIEQKKLARAKEAYLEEIDTLEQYRAAKAAIEAQITEICALRDKEKQEASPKIDTRIFAKKVHDIIAFIERADVSAEAKNAAIRTIVEKIVYEKEKGNLAIYFHGV